MATTKTEPVEVTAHANLAAALAAFQQEIPAVVKGATATVETKAGGQYKYQYADLAVITPLAMPLLGKHGLAFSAQPTMMGDAFVLRYTLMHAGGDTLEGVYPLQDPTTAKPQEIGSLITYARRYAFCAVTGIAPGGDDDDAAVANAKPQAARKPRQTPPPAAPEPPAIAADGWAALILDVNTIDELRVVHAGVEKEGQLGMRFSESDGRFVAEAVKLHELSPPPNTVTVGQFIGAVRKAIETKPMPVEASGEFPPTGDTPAVLTEEWETAEIPTGAEGDE